MSTHLTVAESYYKAIAAKNIQEAAQYLDPEVALLNPAVHLVGKEAVLGALAGFIGIFHTLTVRTTFSARDQAMLVIDLDCVAPIGPLRTASLLTLKNGRISHIELFLDYRPIEKAMKS